MCSAHFCKWALCPQHRTSDEATHRQWKLLSRAGLACPLFGSCAGLPLSLARPLLGPILDITFYISAVLHSHYVLTSTGIKNGIMCCGSVNTTRVDGFMARVHGLSTWVYNFSSFHLQNHGWPFTFSHETDCLAADFSDASVHADSPGTNTGHRLDVQCKFSRVLSSNRQSCSGTLCDVILTSIHSIHYCEMIYCLHSHTWIRELRNDLL